MSEHEHVWEEAGVDYHAVAVWDKCVECGTFSTSKQRDLAAAEARAERYAAANDTLRELALGITTACRELLPAIRAKDVDTVNTLMAIINGADGVLADALALAEQAIGEEAGA